MKFAHLADCHLGAFRDNVLRQLNLEAFKKTIDKIISEKVDFAIIAGDLFHVHIPEISIVNEAVKKMRELKDAGIPLYLIYGSHDYSPTQHSIIDVLESAGLFVKINKFDSNDDKLKLIFTQDQKTGAKLCGISARKLGLEKNYYEMLDLESLEGEEGFKIFVFHNALTESLPSDLQKISSIPISFFPKKFNYYAGGHIHQTSKINPEFYGHFVSPGALFGSNYKDIEKSLEDPNGFFIYEDGNLRFEEIKVAQISSETINVDGKNALQAKQELEDFITDHTFEEKVVLVRILGKLSGGSIADLELSKFKERISQTAKVVYLNTHKLESTQIQTFSSTADSKEEIEIKLFEENLKELNLQNPNLNNHLASRVLNVLKQGTLEGETKKDYQTRVIASALKEMNINEN